jgi:amino acid adenylation domain-containing protein
MQINILEYFEKSVKQYPDKVAVIDGVRKLTFTDLNSLSVNMAQVIDKVLNHQVCKPIAVYLPKSCENVYSDLAITYSGNIYMNLDVKSPISRIESIIDQIRPIAIITNNSNLEKLKGIHIDSIIINLDTLNLSIVTKSGNKFPYNIGHIDTDPYCIINTSGSTGTPKGVVLNHKSFIDFTEWAIDTLGIKNDEIIGSLSPSVFDIYSFELCMLMSKGSTMVIIPETMAAFPAELLRLLNEEHITFIFWVPTVMVNIANLQLLEKVPLIDLKTIWFAGEVFPTKQFNIWKHHLPFTKFVNLYGPIEITLDCTYFIVDRELQDNEPIPIGFPCRNTDILILNEKNMRSKLNEEGELCVRGTSLAMGYYNDPEKTAKAFVQNPLNKSYPELIYRTGDQVLMNDRGEIIFKGRKDSLVKHLGYRIELGEIEHIIINKLKLVENGCVVYDFTRKEIKLFYEAKNELLPGDFRKAISSVLPKYMIPNKFVRMDELPRNNNGKIDRLHLSKQIN